MKQASHSIKVLGLRCINSAVIIHLVTPFVWSLEPGKHLIKAVSSLFFAELCIVQFHLRRGFKTCSWPQSSPLAVGCCQFVM